jgi:hypothetical protein
MYNFVPLNGGRAEYKCASKGDGRNVFEQGKRRLALATWLEDDAAIDSDRGHGPSGMQGTGRPACRRKQSPRAR